MDETKVCTGCRSNLPISHFYLDKRYSAHEKYRPQCRECTNKKARDRYHKDPTRIRDKTYQRRYGISEEQYNVMLEQQDYVCAICNKPERSEKFRFLSVDHNHGTGKVRSLLCALCNRLLGQYEKNYELFSKFEEYINFHDTKDIE